MAVAHLALYETQKAIPLLASLTQQDFPQQKDAQAYLALSYIQIEQIEKAIPILRDLEQGHYQEWATKIINDLE